MKSLLRLLPETISMMLYCFFLTQLWTLSVPSLLYGKEAEFMAKPHFKELVKY